MDPLHVATLNIRNLADRWDERLPLLLADMAALQPDLLGLQEVVYLAPAGPPDRRGRARVATRASAAGPGRPEYGNACSSASRSWPRDAERLDLGLARSALRVAVRLPGGARSSMVVTHLHHPARRGAPRDEQARR